MNTLQMKEFTLEEDEEIKQKINEEEIKPKISYCSMMYNKFDPWYYTIHCSKCSKYILFVLITTIEDEIEIYKTKTFDEIMEYIWNKYIPDIDKAGIMLCYNITVRICYYHKIELPDYVFLFTNDLVCLIYKLNLSDKLEKSKVFCANIPIIKNKYLIDYLQNKNENITSNMNSFELLRCMIECDAMNNIRGKHLNLKERKRKRIE